MNVKASNSSWPYKYVDLDSNILVSSYEAFVLLWRFEHGEVTRSSLG